MTKQELKITNDDIIDVLALRQNKDSGIKPVDEDRAKSLLHKRATVDDVMDILDTVLSPYIQQIKYDKGEIAKLEKLVNLLGATEADWKHVEEEIDKETEEFLKSVQSNLGKSEEELKNADDVEGK